MFYTVFLLLPCSVDDMELQAASQLLSAYYVLTRVFLCFSRQQGWQGETVSKQVFNPQTGVLQRLSVDSKFDSFPCRSADEAFGLAVGRSS